MQEASEAFTAFAPMDDAARCRGRWWAEAGSYDYARFRRRTAIAPLVPHPQYRAGAFRYDLLL